METIQTVKGLQEKKTKADVDILADYFLIKYIFVIYKDL